MISRSSHRGVWLGRWDYPHNNCRHVSLLNRFRSVTVKSLSEFSRHRYLRIVQTLFQTYFVKPFVEPRILRSLSSEYGYLFCTDPSQIPHFSGPVVVDDDDPDFSDAHIRSLNSNNVAAVVTTTHVLREKLLGLGLKKACIVMPSGVDLKSIDEQQIIDIGKKLRYQGDAFVIGFVAPRFYLESEVQGAEQRLRSIGFLCEVMERVWRAVPNVELWLIGAPSRGVIQYAKDRPNIKLVGYVSHDTILNYISNVDIALYPRTQDVGGRHSIKLLQYMACGLPVVSTDVAESFLVKRSGAGVVTSSLEEFADAVINLIGDPGARAEMGRVGKHFADDFDWDVLARRYEQEIFDIYCGPVLKP